jgi:small subunit ribosomal protein S16
VAVRLRLTRVGGKKDPIWRVVVADQRSPRDGRVIEIVGQYNAQTEPSTIVLNSERIEAWLAKGAQPTATVRKLMRIQGIGATATATATAPVVEEQASADEAEPEAPAQEPAAEADEVAAADEPAPDGEAT